MDVVGALTAGAAVLAAALAGINLYITGRRELHKWTRDALVEALVVFLDSSIKQGGLCMAAVSWDSLPEVERDRIRRDIITMHDLQTETLARLRLLAPSRVVAAAQALHQVGHELMSACLPIPSRTAEVNAIALALQHARQQFLESARSTLRLADTAVIQHMHGDASWHQFRSSIHKAVEPERPSYPH
jgi:hypothetical protein